MRKRHLLIGFGSLAMLGACIGHEQPAPPSEPVLTPAAALNVAPADAIASIAAARCDSAMRCNRVGPYGEFKDREHCLNLMRTRSQYEVRDCPHGVDPRTLDRCLSRVSTDPCANVSFQGVDRFTACTDNYLCYR